MKKIFSLINQNILRFFISSSYSQASSSFKPLITISREMGSGGKVIAQKVVKKLGGRWRLYHKDLIEKIAKEAKMEKKLIEEIDEKIRPTLESFILDIFGKEYATLSSYYKALIRVLATIGQRGYAVIIGRGANFLFPNALNVRIICEMSQRIKWLMEFEKISKEEAIRRIKESDKQRKEFVQALFHHDIRKAHHYDLVIRTGKNLDVETAAELIVKLAKKRFKL